MKTHLNSIKYHSHIFKEGVDEDIELLHVKIHSHLKLATTQSNLDRGGCDGVRVLIFLPLERAYPSGSPSDDLNRAMTLGASSFSGTIPMLKDLVWLSWYFRSFVCDSDYVQFADGN